MSDCPCVCDLYPGMTWINNDYDASYFVVSVVPRDAASVYEVTYMWLCRGNVYFYSGYYQRHAVFFNNVQYTRI